MPTDPSDLRRYWLAGFISGAMTLLFFMLIVILSIFNHGVPCAGRFPAVAVLALGVALGLSFIGGAATAQGTLPLPGSWKPVRFAVAGGVASLVIVLLIGWLFYARDCPEPLIESKGQKVEKLLNEAWDLMGGSPNTVWVDAQGQLSSEARQNLEHARRDIDEALGLNPGCDRARDYHAVYQARSGRLKDAERESRQLTQQSPKYARAYNTLGNILSQEGRWEESIASFRAATRVDPDYVLAYYNLGNALKAVKKLPEALEAYSICVAKDSSFARGYNNRGTTYEDLGDHNRAIADYNKAIAIEPGLFEAHVSLGDALMQLGRFAEAVQAYERAVSLAPNDTDLKATLEKARQKAKEVPVPH